MLNDKKKVYKAILWITLLASLVLLWHLSPILNNPSIIPADDFVRHWAAGRLVISGGDPYSPTQIQVLQNQATGNLVISPVITPNYVPPWVMLILAVFGIPSYGISRISWLLFNSLILIISAELIWRVYDGPKNRKWTAWIACLIFAPTISVLEKGQTTSLALIGLAGFLYFLEKRKNPWVAGAFASLVTVKPQLLYLFWLALALWCIYRRDLRVIISMAGTFILMTCAVMILDPSILSQYIQAIRLYPPTMFQTPTIGGYLRYFIFGPDKFWPQYLPLPFGLAWLAYQFYNHRKDWDWRQQTPWLVFASLITSFYSWSYDLVLLALAVIQAWLWIGLIQKRWIVWTLLASYFAITLINLIQHRYLDDFWFLWVTPVILGWYLLAFSQARPGLLEAKRQT